MRSLSAPDAPRLGQEPRPTIDPADLVAALVGQGTTWSLAVADGSGRVCWRNIVERADRGAAGRDDLSRAWRALTLDAVNGSAADTAVAALAAVDLQAVRGLVVVDQCPRRSTSSGAPALSAELGVEVRELDPVVAGALAAAARPGLAGPSDRVALLDVGPELAAAVVAQGRLVIGGADPGTGRRRLAGRADDRAPDPGPGSASRARRRTVAAVEGGVAVTWERLLGRAAHAGAVLTACFDLDTLVLGGLAADLDTDGRAALEGSVRRSLDRAASAVTSRSARELRVAFLPIDDELVMQGALGHARRHLAAGPMAAGPVAADAATPGPRGSGRP